MSPSYLEVAPSCPQPGHQFLFLGKSSLLPQALIPSSAAEVEVQSCRGLGRDKARFKAWLSHLPICLRWDSPADNTEALRPPHRPVA